MILAGLEPGARVRVRGHEGILSRERSPGWWVVRMLDVNDDVRPAPGRELVSPEVVAYVGEIEVL